MMITMPKWNIDGHQPKLDRPPGPAPSGGTTGIVRGTRPFRTRPLIDHRVASLAYALWDSENTIRMKPEEMEEHILRARTVLHWLNIHGHDVVWKEDDSFTLADWLTIVALVAVCMVSLLAISGLAHMIGMFK